MRNIGVRTDGSTDIADALFVPITGPLDSTGIANVRFKIWLVAEDVVVAPGVQYSDDGVNWGGAGDRGIVDAYNGENADPWIEDDTSDPDDLTILDDWVACPGGFSEPTDTGSGTALTKNRIFVRFGVWIRNKSGASGPRGATVAMAVEVQRDLTFHTEVSEMVLVPSGGSGNTVFTPLTRAVRTGSIVRVRVSLDVEANGGIEIEPAYVLSSDGVSWDSDESLDTSGAVSAEGVHAGTAFKTKPAGGPEFDAKRLARFGVRATNLDTMDAEILGALVAIRIDTRDE